MTRRGPRQPAPDRGDWIVSVDLTGASPVTPRELDAFERYFGDIVDAIFDPSGPDAHNTARTIVDPLRGNDIPLARRSRPR